MVIDTKCSIVAPDSKKPHFSRVMEIQTTTVTFRNAPDSGKLPTPRRRYGQHPNELSVNFCRDIHSGGLMHAVDSHSRRVDGMLAQLNAIDLMVQPPERLKIRTFGDTYDHVHRCSTSKERMACNSPSIVVRSARVILRKSGEPLISSFFTTNP